MSQRVMVVEQILNANDQLAAENRLAGCERGIRDQYPGFSGGGEDQRDLAHDRSAERAAAPGGGGRRHRAGDHRRR